MLEVLERVCFVTQLSFLLFRCKMSFDIKLFYPLEYKSIVFFKALLLKVKILRIKELHNKYFLVNHCVRLYIYDVYL